MFVTVLFALKLRYSPPELLFRLVPIMLGLIGLRHSLSSRTLRIVSCEATVLPSLGDNVMAPENQCYLRLMSLQAKHVERAVYVRSPHIRDFMADLCKSNTILSTALGREQVVTLSSTVDVFRLH